MPPIAHAIVRWRETSSSISVVAWLPVEAGASASPVAGEVADAGLDLVEADMLQTPRGDDYLTIYHDVGDGARRERVD
ncbi:MAG TPA: hypothetical protein VLT45_08715, partial [Kofleriaceae bacterium]|nr:hypothetical protein [Kofleriaceae bacterium]